MKCSVELNYARVLGGRCETAAAILTLQVLRSYLNANITTLNSGWRAVNAIPRACATLQRWTIRLDILLESACFFQQVVLRSYCSHEKNK